MEIKHIFLNNCNYCGTEYFEGVRDVCMNTGDSQERLFSEEVTFKRKK